MIESLVGLELRVRDLEACVSYYQDVLGLTVVDVDRERTSLAPAGRLFRLDLLRDPDAPLRPYPCVGLYHFALVVPDRAALGAILHRLIDQRADLEGMSDHGVSEALYLRDPEQNGIELYRDRPREDWTREPDGSLRMTLDPFDADGVLASAKGPGPLDDLTRFGHIHLHVPTLEGAEAFFADDLGLGVTQRSLNGALFFAAGNYHHHVGANVWAPRHDVPDGATGLVSYTWRVTGGPKGALIDPVGAEVRFEAM
jgi:catechol 2,3-dioxygenase